MNWIQCIADTDFGLNRQKVRATIKSFAIPTALTEHIIAITSYHAHQIGEIQRNAIDFNVFATLTNRMVGFATEESQFI